MACYPSYDPSIWVGGITQEAVQGAHRQRARCLATRTQGQFAPGVDVQGGQHRRRRAGRLQPYGSTTARASPGRQPQTFRNFESAAYGRISLTRAPRGLLQHGVLRDRVRRCGSDDGGPDADRDAAGPDRQRRPQAFGFGKRTGIDLPGEARGRVGESRLQGRQLGASEGHLVRATRERATPRRARPTRARPTTTRRSPRRTAPTATSTAAVTRSTLAIGQGDTVVTPLQMAMVYAAIANGGKLWQPQVAKGDRQRARQGRQASSSRMKIGTLRRARSRPSTFLRNAFSGRHAPTARARTRSRASRSTRSRSRPRPARPGHRRATQSTSWFASFAPANKPRVRRRHDGHARAAPGRRRPARASARSTRRSSASAACVVDPSTVVLVGGEPQATVRGTGHPHPDGTAGRRPNRARTRGVAAGPTRRPGRASDEPRMLRHRDARDAAARSRPRTPAARLLARPRLDPA